MPTAAFTTLGCKVNQYETQRILESFECAGFRIVPFTEPADVYVINTCSVTSQAESKSRQTIRRAGRQNPDAKVVVTGCAAQMSINKGEEMLDTHLVVPNPSKLETFELFARSFPELIPVAPSAVPSEVVGRTRATVKIQDGCSVYCSYCSIPYTRPKMMSRPYEEVLEEVRLLGRRGYKEIILTGVLIGAYGPETGSGGPDFEDLVSLLCEIPEIDRIRISSIEMRQVTPRLVALISCLHPRRGGGSNSPSLFRGTRNGEGTRGRGKVVPHLHIPLQSGSTKVLTDMNRPYSQSDYIELCLQLYREIPDLAISTDIMVGFPTETTEEFAETVKVCEEVRFAKAHLFRFSPRYGTPADEWGDAVSPQEKQERSKALMEVTNRTRSEFISRFVGRDMEVLVEQKSASSGLLRGHTGNYIEVEFAGPQELVGRICSVRLLSAEASSATGELVRLSRDDARVRHLPVLNN